MHWGFCIYSHFFLPNYPALWETDIPTCHTSGWISQHITKQRICLKSLRDSLYQLRFAGIFFTLLYFLFFVSFFRILICHEKENHLCKHQTEFWWSSSSLATEFRSFPVEAQLPAGQRLWLHFLPPEKVECRREGARGESTRGHGVFGHAGGGRAGRGSCGLVVVDVDVDDTVVWSIQSILHFWLPRWSLKWSMASSSRHPEWSHTSFEYPTKHS